MPDYTAAILCHAHLNQVPSDSPSNSVRQLLFNRKKPWKGPVTSHLHEGKSLKIPPEASTDSELSSLYGEAQVSTSLLSCSFVLNPVVRI